MAQETAWADHAGDAKSPGETGLLAEQHDVEAHDTTKFSTDAERPRAFAQRLDASTSMPSLNRRRAASRRLPPLECGHRDPLSCVAENVPFVIGPCRYGLTIEQARRHANDLVVLAGWSVAEVVEVLGIEPKVAA